MLSLSVKAKYGLSAMVALASQQEGTLQSRQISQQERLPLAFLEQLLSELKKAGFIKSFRGSQGGYALAKTTKSITVYDILTCLEGPSDLCTNGTNSLEWFWKQKESELAHLFETTLEDLVSEHQKHTGKWSYSI
jgi:Rrf2 family protein